MSDQDIKQVVTYDNLAIKQEEVFNKGMQAFNAGNVKDARKYLADAVYLTQLLLLRGGNSSAEQYADLIKQINELIEMHLTEQGQEPIQNLFPFVNEHDVPINKIPLYLRTSYSNSSAEDQKLISEVYQRVANPLNRHLFIGGAAESCLQGAIKNLEDGDVASAKESASAASGRLRILSEQTSDPDVKETFLKMASFIDSKMEKKIEKNNKFPLAKAAKAGLKNYIEKQEEKEYERYKREGGPGIRVGFGVQVAKSILGNRSFYESKTYHEIMYKGIDIIQRQYNQKKKFDAGVDAMQKGRLEVAKFLLYDAYCDAQYIVSNSAEKKDQSEYEKIVKKIDALMKSQLAISAEDYEKQLKKEREKELEEFNRREKENEA